MNKCKLCSSTVDTDSERDWIDTRSASDDYKPLGLYHLDCWTAKANPKRVAEFKTWRQSTEEKN